MTDTYIGDPTFDDEGRDAPGEVDWDNEALQDQLLARTSRARLWFLAGMPMGDAAVAYLAGLDDRQVARYIRGSDVLSRLALGP